MGIREGIRHHDQATIRPASLCGNDAFELGRVANRCSDRLHGEGRSGGFEGSQPIFEICRRCWVEQEGYPVDARRNLLEQLQPLASHRRLHSDETGDVSSRPRKARDEAAADRIGNERENDGDGACLLQHRRGDRCALRKNEVGLQRDEFLRKSLHRLGVAGCRPAGVHPDIAALCPAELLKSLPQSRDAGLPYRIVRGEWHDHADAPHPFALLRARRERPGDRCAAEKRDELAPRHSITSSARASNASGTVKPSALAVFKFMISSKWVGCSTGRSAGWAPLRILSTYTAALRNRSGYLGEYAISPPSSANQRGTETAGTRCLSASSAARLLGRLG